MTPTVFAAINNSSVAFLSYHPELFSSLQIQASFMKFTHWSQLLLLSGQKTKSKCLSPSKCTSWRYWGEIKIHNGVLFTSHKVLIPKLLQEEILGKIHSSHLGIESCLRKLETVCSGPAWVVKSSKWPVIVRSDQNTKHTIKVNPYRHMTSLRDHGGE